jgi:hypothetical protein
LASSAIPCDGADDARARFDHPQPLVAAVRDVKIPGVVEINRVRTAKLGAGGGTAVSRKSGNAGTGDDPHTPAGRIDSDHPVALSLGDVEGPVGACGETKGELEAVGPNYRRSCSEEPGDHQRTHRDSLSGITPG